MLVPLLPCSSKRPKSSAWRWRTSAAEDDAVRLLQILPTRRCARPRGRAARAPSLGDRVPRARQRQQTLLGGQPIRSLFTPFDARADIILYPCRSPHGGRLKDPMTWLHAHGPCACSRQGPSISAQGARKWEGQRSRPSATRATAAPRPERTNKAFDFAAWKGGVRCSDAVQAMAAWLARCGRVPVQRAARSHATASGSPIREEFSR